MTVIVAALFLPYTPQFQINASPDETAKLVESHQIKEPKKRASSVHANPPIVEIPSGSPSPLIMASGLPPSSRTNSLVNSGPVSAVMGNSVAGTANASVEDFFFNNKSVVNSGTSTPHFVSEGSRTTTESMLKTVTKQLHSGSATVIQPRSTFTRKVSSTVMDKKDHDGALKRAASTLKYTLASVPASSQSVSASVPGVAQSVPVSATDAKRMGEAVTDADFDEEGADTRDAPGYGGYSGVVGLHTLHSENIFATAPWHIVEQCKGNGGMKNAIRCAIDSHSIEDVKWVGTVGIATDAVPKKVMDDISNKLAAEYSSAAVVTDDVTFKGAYKNFCKQILWPTLHYQIPDNPNSKAFEDHSWEHYCKLNRQFADKIISEYKEGDIIWVHDYHLMLVPMMVRERFPLAKIGFFLHVSFPSSEVFRCFAHREKILRGIVGANSVAFQTEEYARHFLQTSNRLIMADIDKVELRYKGRIISVRSCPIGIDYFVLDEQVRSQAVHDWRSLIRERWHGKKIILGRDQFDRIRGLPKKLLAYEKFLKENPEYIDKCVLIQICLTAASDPELERYVMGIVDRINALSTDISVSQPVVFLYQDLDFSQYLGLSAEADLFWVNSMREGMNLTCHEFVVCTQSKASPLLLSEFTGSASVLDGSTLINPWDIRQVSNAIKSSLEMPLHERRKKWKQMFKAIITHDSETWVTNAICNINSSWSFNRERQTVFNVDSNKIITSFAASKKRLLILKLSQPPSERMLSILGDLSHKCNVFVVNHFSQEVLARHYARAPDSLGLIAENGAFVRINGKWYPMVEDTNWMEEVQKVLASKTERLPGSYMKLSESMIRFHTENAEDKDRVSAVVGDAITHVNTVFMDRDVHAYLHHGVLFVQQPGLMTRAFHFLLYHLNTQNNEPHSPLGSPIVLSKAPSFENFGRAPNRVDFVCVSGSSSPFLEPLFQQVNTMAKVGDLQHVFTIVYGEATSTYAKEHIEGINELFNVLQKVDE